MMMLKFEVMFSNNYSLVLIVFQTEGGRDV